ncbi:acyl-CoA carboxylase subunit epsilon [Streptomyces alkaliterrae]|uniref:Acyl-CoA carboxylase subunit epsilon n=1 Tax=Streptomyces alkaliterrae TaxID=2213162 RepID=A0A5P0YLA0_9ACTN|nr:acyl-CoA carboxylase subunit epsilon [Streptomyces alkaliterrae]MBB1254593.1 acyl-CoA carboxylase subunit epsilon [Streptomyces alkaliterrae]MBB1257835.1 acyl-CoA carboxylase subunit epsilon [Streptomyces alkaliterrae]MQS01123.1 acyl-CoA carboxylase subunit epsilon [Streptomyces alkaliterrae]
MTQTDPTTQATPDRLFRISKGSPDPAELAALTAVLLSRTAAAGAEPDDLSRRQRAVARWRRPERARGFDGPRSWRSTDR